MRINQDTLDKFGAVSEETVREMAEKVREIFASDYGLATSGVAGPGGGTKEKPVGTVWIAVSNGEETVTKRLMLTKDRDVNIKLTSVMALNLLYQRMREKD